MSPRRGRALPWLAWPIAVAALATACSSDGPGIASSGVAAGEPSLTTSSVIVEITEPTSGTVPSLSVDLGAPTTETPIADSSETGPPTAPVPSETTGSSRPTTAERTVVTTPVTTGTTAAPADTGRSHPDCSTGCTVLIEGDSLTSSLARFLEEQVPASVTVVDSGQGGKRIDEMLVAARSDVDLHADERPDDILFLWAGINDLNQRRHATDPAENARLVAELLGDYVAERRANGWDWIVVLTMPRTTPTIEGWVELNRILTTADIGADQVLDIGADPVLADPFDPVHKNPDGLHLSGEGARHVAVAHLLPVVAQASR